MILSVFISKRFALVVLDVFHFSVVISFLCSKKNHMYEINTDECRNLSINMKVILVHTLGQKNSQFTPDISSIVSTKQTYPDLSTPHPDDSNQIGCQKIPVLKSTVGSLSSTLSRSPCSAYSPINCVVIISIMTSVDDMRCHFLIIVRSSCKTKRTCNLQFTRSVMIYVLILL